MGVGRALRRGLRVVTRPVRRSRGGIVVQPYRGYGSNRELFLMGRVFRQAGDGTLARDGSLGRDLIDLGRRLTRWGVGGATLAARSCGAERCVQTDRDGYFRVHLELERRPDPELQWQPVELELRGADADATARGEVYVPPPRARCVVISDIDDTVMHTGVAQRAKMLWRLFVQDAASRTAFPGVAALYRALHHGRSGDECNPMLYVSRAPWSLYEVLEEFFNRHGIPVGPILFLREWGLTLQRPLPRRAKGHKLDLIRDMLELYDELPFVLVGDSGQRDAEIYAEVVRDHPGRVRAIYIRDLGAEAERRRAIEALAEEVVAAGSHLLLAADSFAMAEHAAELGLISADALAAVLAEREATEEASDRAARERSEEVEIERAPRG